MSHTRTLHAGITAVLALSALVLAAPVTATAQAAAGASRPAAVTGNFYSDEFGTFRTTTRSGRGDAVVALPAGARAGIVTATHTGSSNFSVNVLNARNQATGDLLVNEIGSYKGTTAFGLSSFSDAPRKLEVTADGRWTLRIAPMSTAPLLRLPSSTTGDRVYRYEGPVADWRLTHNGDSNFAVIQYGPYGYPDLAVNEIGAYKGVVAMQGGPSVVVVTADGTWTARAQ